MRAAFWYRLLCGLLLFMQNSSAIIYDGTGTSTSYNFPLVGSAYYPGAGVAAAYLGNVFFRGFSILYFADTVTSTLNISGRCAAAIGGGHVELGGDLIAGYGFAINQATSMQGNGHVLKLGGPMLLDSSNKLTISNGSAAPFSGNLIIDGQGNKFILGNRVGLALDANVSLTLRNMDLWIGENLGAVNGIVGSGATSFVTLDNVRIMMSGLGADIDGGDGSTPVTSKVVSTAQLFIENEVSFNSVNPLYNSRTSPSIFQYTNPYPIRIAVGGQLTMGCGTTLDMTGSTNLSFIMADSSSKLCFDNSQFIVPSSLGATMLGGMLIFKNYVQIKNTGATTAAHGVVLGDGVNSKNNVDVIIDGGASVIVDGYLGYNPAQNTASYGGLTFNVAITRDSSSNIIQMVLTNPGTGDTITLNSFDYTNYTMSFGLSSQTIVFTALSSKNSGSPVTLGCWPQGTGFLLAAPPPGASPSYVNAGYTPTGSSNSLDVALGYSSGTGIGVIMTLALTIPEAFPGLT